MKIFLTFILFFPFALEAIAQTSAGPLVLCDDEESCTADLNGFFSEDSFIPYAPDANSEYFPIIMANEPIDICITIRCPQSIDLSAVGLGTGSLTLTNIEAKGFGGLPEGVNYCLSEANWLPDEYYTIRLTGTPTQAGTFQFKLSAVFTGSLLSVNTDSFYPDGMDFIQLTVSDEPIAEFSYDVTQQGDEFSVQFNDLSTNMPTSWSWSFENGMPATSSEQNPVVTFANEGNYIVSLVVENDFGRDSIAHTINITSNIPQYTITVLSNNDSYGSVMGGGTYEEGSVVTISAMPYEGYSFVSWDDGNTDNPRNIVVTSDSTFVANFEAIEANTYTITVLSNNDAYGSVSGGGTYYDGDTVTISAIPNAGYSFVSWNDENESNPRTIVVRSDSTFIANFAKCEITYTIDTVVNNFVTVGDHTFYSTGNYTFTVPSETGCDTIYDLQLRVLAEPVYNIGPNPTKSLLNINSDSFISAVEFYSITGQVVMRKEVNGYEVEFDMERLVDGVYIMRIYGEKSSLPSVSKVVKE